MRCHSAASRWIAVALGIATGLGLFAVSISCTSSEPFADIQPITHRMVLMDSSALHGGTAAHHTLTGAAGMVAGVVPGAGVAVPLDTDAMHRGVKPIVTKYEVNFGDGLGWEDVTVAQLGFDYITSDGMDPERCAQHTYSMPGVYTIDARATYWDGEVLYASQFGETVTVTITVET